MTNPTPNPEQAVLDAKFLVTLKTAVAEHGDALRETEAVLTDVLQAFDVSRDRVAADSKESFFAQTVLMAAATVHSLLRVVETTFAEGEAS